LPFRRDQLGAKGTPRVAAINIPLKEGADMASIAARVAAFLKSEDGPTSVEYAVMLALIVSVCVTAITSVGNNANKTFTTISNKLAGTGS
jgi:pilus assembly protein Flp/PilA